MTKERRRFAVALPSTDLPMLAGTAWRWWIGELWGMVPPPLRRLLRARRVAILVDVLEGEVAVSQATADDRAEIYRIPLHELGAASGPPAALRDALDPRKPVILRLPGDRVLRKPMELPLAAARNLRQILTFELDRQSPLDPAQVRFDYRIVKRDKPAKKITVELRIVKRQSIEQAVALCRLLGLEPRSLGFHGEAPAMASGAFLAGEPKPSTRRWLQRRAAAALMGLAGLLSLAMLLTALDRQQARADAIAARLTHARAQAQATERLRKDIAALAARAEFLPREKQRPLIVKVIEEVTRLLPDDSWLVQLDLSGSEVHLRGYSASAPALIGLFDGSPLFTNAHFRAPLTQGPRSDLERFDLSFDVKGGGS